MSPFLVNLSLKIDTGAQRFSEPLTENSTNHQKVMEIDWTTE